LVMFCQKLSIPIPLGATAPRPVTTTRAMLVPQLV
jgi:hypothetical protein